MRFFITYVEIFCISIIARTKGVEVPLVSWIFMSAHYTCFFVQPRLNGS